ncbi:MAG: transcription antitermination factor NusB [Bdellovibrionales bacterium]|nr:transcription antitermination factor NusB [Bdellovibrionales bacterium]
MSSPKTSQRHRAREIALQILYSFENATVPRPADAAELARVIRGHFDHFQVSTEAREFAAELVAGSLREQAALDAWLDEHSSNWKVSRMAAIDRCILRLAALEMRHFPDIPKAVTIDEAVELAKKFGEKEAPQFVNGLLDALPVDKK